MTDKDTPLGKLVPGFEFLQGLVKNAGAALPGVPGIGQLAKMGQWVAPTLNPEELAKRIEELRAVQFWLEQNTRTLDATIQALEVQRMTLSALHSMNVPVAALREAVKARVPGGAEKPRRSRKPAPQAATVEPVDPMQWWGALTQQFTQLAGDAMKDSAGHAAKAVAGAVVKQGLGAAQRKLRRKV